MKIGVFDYTLCKEDRKKFYEMCDDIFDIAYLSNHKYVKQFEQAFATFSNSTFSLAVSNGTTAIEAALRVVGVQGREVIIPTNTFIATYVAVINTGGIPVICDVDDQYYSLDPKQVEKKINNNTVAIITVHTGGYINPNILDLVDLSTKHNLSLLEDAAHAHGSKFKSQNAGTFGRFGTFSHFLTKVMTTGEGGSIVCKTQEDWNELSRVRRFGMSLDDSTIHTRDGANYKLSEFQAALGLIELGRVKSRILRRRQIAQRYLKNLKGSSIQCLEDTSDMETSHYKFIALSPIPNEELKDKLSKFSIPLTGGVYNMPVHQQPIVISNGHSGGSFKNAENFAKFHICPPAYPEVTDDQVDFICEKLIELTR